ncbi:cell wall bioproteinsis protein [Perkinsus olseni]|uniref:diphthine methyl ester synthase n=4 Tax=Perkinsus olseni TaxID=32597 RepID=A0A7J6NWR7_PEROL|nr:cell wall bioproteinsis protein [Perkinsus olseni]
MGKLTFIGLGLGDPKDITLKGLDALREADYVYLESYTSVLVGQKPDDLRKAYGIEVPFIEADRHLVEGGCEEMLDRATEKNVCFCVVGDALCATTHTDLFLRAKAKNIEVSVVHNASIMNAIACCGLHLYRFGETVSICFWDDSWKPDSYFDKIADNAKRGLHTLCLLDIKVKEQSIVNLMKGNDIYEPPRFMSVQTALQQLMEIDENRGNPGIVGKDSLVVGVARVGCKDQSIVFGRAEDVASDEAADRLGGPLHSLVICAQGTEGLQEMEQEFVEHVEEVFEIITPEWVRNLRDERPYNMQFLLRKIVGKVEEVCSTGLAEHQQAEGGGSRELTLGQRTEALQCVRLLTRIAPFLLEDVDAEGTLTLLWHAGGLVVRDCGDSVVVEPAPPPTERSTNGKDEEEVNDDGASEGSSVEDEADLATAPLMYRILRALQWLLFLKDFTVLTPQGASLPLPTHRVESGFVWKGGVGTAEKLPVAQNNEVLSARCEVLKCLLTLLSEPLFQPISSYSSDPSRVLLTFCSGDLPYTANLFCSLMSTVVAYDPKGYGLPYGSAFSSGSQEALVDLSSQVLCAVLDFNPSAETAGSEMVKSHRTGTGPEEASNNSEKEDSNTEEAAARRRFSSCAFPPTGSDGDASKPRNVYRIMAKGVDKPTELDFMADGLVRIVATVDDAKQTYLPSSRKPVPFFQESLILLWHLITINPAFRKRLCSRHTEDILHPLLDLLVSSRNSQAKIGLLHMCSFILLVLSSDRDFAVALNAPFKGRRIQDVPVFTGTLADLMTLSIYRVVSDALFVAATAKSPTTGAESLIDMMLTSLCNISSTYWKRFSKPHWLFKGPLNHNAVFFIIESLNNVIQYQYEGNHQLVYSILRHKEVFDSLKQLKLPKPSPSVSTVPSTAAESSVDGDHGTSGQEQASQETGEHPVNEFDEFGRAVGSPEERVKKQTALMHQAAGASGDPSAAEQKWAPTEAWLEEWKNKLMQKMETIDRLFNALYPKIVSECESEGVTDQNGVLELLKDTTMSLLTVILLTICTCTLLKPRFPSFIDNHKPGFVGFFGRFAVIGERLSPYVSLACIIMAVVTLFLR